MNTLPAQRRSLMLALGFRDAFIPESSGVLIAVPLEVDVAGRRAWRGDDATYRVSMAGPTPVVPALPWPVTVAVPSGDYVAFEPMTVTVAPVPSTPPTRADYLRVLPLWPTRRLRVPPGETAVHAVIRQAGAPQAGLRVQLHAGPVPPAGTPQARTDEGGTFVYRLPFLSGTPSSAALSLTVTVRDGVTPVTVTPSTLTLARGRLHTLSFERL